MFTLRTLFLNLCHIKSPLKMIFLAWSSIVISLGGVGCSELNLPESQEETMSCSDEVKDNFFILQRECSRVFGSSSSKKRQSCYQLAQDFLNLNSEQELSCDMGTFMLDRSYIEEQYIDPLLDYAEKERAFFR